MADTTRNVEVKLKFTGDASGGSKAMADLQAQAGRAGKAIEDVNKQMKALDGGPTGTRDALVMGFAKAAAAGMAFAKALEETTKVIDIFHKSTATAAERFATVMGVATFGLSKIVTDKIDRALYGDSRRAHDFDLEREGFNQGRINLGSAMRRQERDNRDERWRTVLGADVQFQSSRAGVAIGARGRAAGDDQRIIDARIGEAGAWKSLGMASELHERSGMEKGAVAAQLDALKQEKRMMELARPVRADGDVWGKELDKSQLRQKDMEILKKEEELQQAINIHKKNAFDLEQKRFEFSKASIGVSRAELEILKEKEGAAKANARQFGAMSGAEKLALQSAMQQAKANGIESLPENMRGLLLSSGITGEWGAKQLEKSVQGDPVYKSLVADVGGKTLEQATKAKVELEHKIDLQVVQNEQKLADGIKAEMEKAFNDVDNLITNIVRAQLKILLNQRRAIE